MTTEELKLPTFATLQDAIDYLAINGALPAVAVDSTRLVRSPEFPTRDGAAHDGKTSTRTAAARQQLP
jgi:hypothetical protein